MSYIQLEDLKTYLGIPLATTSDDALLRSMISHAGKAIETYCGRKFEAWVETRYYRSDALIEGNTLLLDTDLIAVNTLTNGDTAATVIPATEYWLVDRNFGPPYYGIKLKSSSTHSWQWDTDCWVSVAATWGYSTTPPEDVSQAAIRLSVFFYRQKDAQVYDTIADEVSGRLFIPKGMPNDVKQLLDPYRKRAG